MLDLLPDQVAPSVSALLGLVNISCDEIRETHCLHLIVAVVAPVGKPLPLDDQGHSPHPRGEDILWQLYASDGLQYGIHFSETRSSHRQPPSASPEVKRRKPTNKK
jgi:hypothetical protein